MKWQRYMALALLFIGSTLFAQERVIGTQLLDSLIAEKKFQVAADSLQGIINKFTQQKKFDSLAYYTYYVGNIALLQYNKKTARTKAEDYYHNLKIVTQDPAILRQACMSMASLYDRLGLPEMGYAINEEALFYTSKIPEAPGRLFGVIHSNLGTSALRNGDIKNAITQYRKTIQRYDSDATTTAQDYYFGYSSMGTAMYYSSKIDSAIYFYKKSIEKVQKLDSSAINLYYRPSLLYNNIAGLYSMEGNSDKALDAMKQALFFNKKFIESNAEDYKINDSKKGYYQGIENYAGIYQTLGEYKKAHDLLVYANQLKQKNLPAESPEIFKSNVLMGQSNFTLLNYKEAAMQLDKAIQEIAAAEGNFLTWNAEAHYGRAQIYEQEGNIENAATYYKKALLYYEQSQQGTYDENYIRFLRDVSLFYSKNKRTLDAINTATKAYEFMLKSQGANSFPTLKETLNMAEIYYNSNNYKESLLYSNKTINIIDSIILQEKKSVKTNQLQLLKPKAILLKNEARISLENELSIPFLIDVFQENEKGLSILEQQKQRITTSESITLLNSENNAIYNFSKKTALHLFNKTNDVMYLNKVLAIHETNIYSKIRSRLNSINALKFSNIPDTILAQERALKERLNNTKDGINTYIKTQDEWNNFITTIKKEYPKYYSLRYENKVANISEIQQTLPADQTAIRYFFIDTQAYALVITQENFSFKKLDNSELKIHINALQQDAHDIKKITNAAHQLYLKLWKPIEGNIKTKRVLIIPDGLLFNLSFETLTPIQLTSFEGFGTHSLVSKYAFSYNYSLQLIGSRPNTTAISNNFIGFAPGFSSSLKEQYESQQIDSVNIDYEYLRLLPQPFSLDMVKKSKKDLGGSIYIEAKASEANFITKAPNHKIIHIGTHAESNNISPELSRLIFAKNNTTEDNYLYNYEIYNLDLSSHLAVLTACETGKPTHQPGEGMISLAHAFTYAGSESMLTSLWKIDEKSSAEIVGYFYKNLQEGMTKDIALQQAKQHYLTTAKGRTLAPQYWAGLILIGDTSPIELQTSSNLWVWIVSAIGLLLLLLILFREKK